MYTNYEPLTGKQACVVAVILLQLHKPRALQGSVGQEPLALRAYAVVHNLGELLGQRGGREDAVRRVQLRQDERA